MVKTTETAIPPSTQLCDKSTMERMDIAGHELAMSLRNAYLAMHRATNACLSDTSLSADSFTVLTALADYGSMTQKELVHKICSDANTVSAMLTRLEKRGLIARKRDANDGRARIVDLTDEGRITQQYLWKKSRSLRFKLTGSIEPNELQNLTTLLKRIACEMDRS